MTFATPYREFPIARALLVATIPAASGCPPVCEGAGCETTFDAALVSVQRGSDQPDFGVVAPTSAAASLSGGSDLGPEWSLAFVGTQLAVGMPDVSSVRTYDLALGGDIAVDSPVGTLLAETPGDSLGAALAVVPDADGDGIAELLVGAPLRDGSVTTMRDGAVFLLSGLGDGFSLQVTASDFLLRVTGDQSGAHLGSVVAGCADTDGDDRGDLAFSAPWYDLDAEGGPALAGRTWLVSGGGLEAGDDRVAGDLGIGWSGASLGAKAGSALDCSHDLTGDGLADIVIGAPFGDSDLEAAGMVYVVEGGADPAVGGLVSASSVALAGEQDEAWLGWSVGTGDVDGDGYADLLAGEPGTSTQTGRVLLWLGPDLGASSAGRADYRIFGPSPGDAFGRTVTVADLDGDGAADVLVGAPKFNPSSDRAASTYDSGALYRIDGGHSSWAFTMLAEDEAVITYVEGQQYLRTGQRVAVGDYDSDGRRDVALLHRHD